jgi:hypothetical protein
VCLLDFCITQILTSTTVIIECTSWLIKVTDNNDARWKPETAVCSEVQIHKHLEEFEANLKPVLSK